MTVKTLSESPTGQTKVYTVSDDELLEELRERSSRGRVTLSEGQRKTLEAADD